MAAATDSKKALKDCTNDFNFEEDDEPQPSKRRVVTGSGVPAGAKGRSDAAAAAADPAAAEPNDPHRLAQRQKQIDFGKNTLGYEFYTKMVPRDKRRRKNGVVWIDPATPDIDMTASKRCFDGLVRVWRKSLHKYDELAKAKGYEPEAAQEVLVVVAAAVPKAKAAAAAMEAESSDSDEPSCNPDAPAADELTGSEVMVSPPQKAPSPLPSTGSKRYFGQAFMKGAKGSGTPAKEPSPKKVAGTRTSGRAPRQMDPNNILDMILGVDASTDGVSRDGISTGSGYLLVDDAGVSNSSFCGRLNRLDVQL